MMHLHLEMRLLRNSFLYVKVCNLNAPKLGAYCAFKPIGCLAYGEALADVNHYHQYSTSF